MKRIWIIIPLLLLTVVFSCNRKPRFFVEEGELTFSTDTVFFDTIFTSVKSPSERLIVTNNTGKNVRISDIRLESGVEYDMIFDGLTGDQLSDYELADGDSAVAFFNFTSNRKDAFARDRVLFTVGDVTQAVDIEAYIFDGIFLRDTILGYGVPSTTFTWTSDKKYVIDGYCVVPNEHILIIEAGTQVYFTARKDTNYNLSSSLIIYNRLIVNGQSGNEVVFQSSRFGDRYEETPGQWRGIAFAQSAQSCNINHAIIKNALIGIYQEYDNVSTFFPKITLNACEIRNMAAYGILSVGYIVGDISSMKPMIRGVNTLVHNCSDATFAAIGGGKYQFDHCTFANYSIDFTRNKPQLILNNYDPDTYTTFNMDARFRNCIIWGSEEDEYAPDSFPVADKFNVTFTDCLLRTTLDLPNADILNSVEQGYPQFVAPLEYEPDERDYHLNQTSPAVNSSINIGINVDKDNVTRDQWPDRGCYEFIQ